MTTQVSAKKSLKRGQRVNTKHVDALVSNYKKQRWMQNSEKLGKADSLSCWYGLDELATFLDEARKNQADGIKMYFGVYPNDFPEVPEYEGRQTVVLVATKQKMTGTGVLNKDIYLNKDGHSEILAFNLTQLCPPFCGTGLPPDGDGAWGIDMEKTGISIIDKGDQIIIA